MYHIPTSDSPSFFLHKAWIEPNLMRTYSGKNSSFLVRTDPILGEKENKGWRAEAPELLKVRERKTLKRVMISRTDYLWVCYLKENSVQIPSSNMRTVSVNCYSLAWLSTWYQLNVFPTLGWGRIETPCWKRIRIGRDYGQGCNLLVQIRLRKIF